MASLSIDKVILPYQVWLYDSQGPISCAGGFQNLGSAQTYKAWLDERKFYAYSTLKIVNVSAQIEINLEL